MFIWLIELNFLSVPGRFHSDVELKKKKSIVELNAMEELTNTLQFSARLSKDNYRYFWIFIWGQFFSKSGIFDKHYSFTPFSDIGTTLT